GTTGTGAAWIVPRKYVGKVGEDGFKKAPVGAGPYRFVSFTPGVELVLEAYEQYWRKAPSVRRLVFKSVVDETTRLAMLKRGETDIAHSIRGELAEEIRRTPGLALKPTGGAFTEWVVFIDQWDPKSPWSDRRVRLAANHAIDRQAINQAEYLGLSKVTGSIIPVAFEFVWPAPLYPYDPQKAKRLLAEAGYPNGFDAGQISADLVYAPIAALVGTSLQAAEPDRKKREAILHRIQQLMHEKAMFAPLFEPAFLNGVGPRVAESGLGLITNHGYSAPYEDLKLKAR